MEAGKRRRISGRVSQATPVPLSQAGSSASKPSEPQTAEDVIRVLKGADSANEAEKHKIQVAAQAWSTPESQLYFPNKDKTIGRWLISHLAKVAKGQGSKQSTPSKGKRKANNADNDTDASILDPNYWQLLERILQGGDQHLASYLVQEQSPLPIAQALLSELSKQSQADFELIKVSAETLNHLVGAIVDHPSGSVLNSYRTADFETLQRCLHTSFGIFDRLRRGEHGPYIQVQLLIKSLYRAWERALPTGANATKALKLLLSETLPEANALASQTASGETIPCFDRFLSLAFISDELVRSELASLSTPLPATGETAKETFAMLVQTLIAVTPLPAEILIRLLAAFVSRAATTNERALRRSTAVAKVPLSSIRSRALQAHVLPVWRHLQTLRDSATRVDALSKLTQTLCTAEIYQASVRSSHAEWNSVLLEMLDDALSRLNSGSEGSADLSTVLSIWSLDSSSAGVRLQETLEAIMGAGKQSSDAGVAAQARKLYRLVLDVACRMRSMPFMLQALSQAAGAVLSRTSSAIDVFRSVVFLPESLAALRNGVQYFMRAAQILDLLAGLAARWGEQGTAYAVQDKQSAAAQLAVEAELGSHIISAIDLMVPDRSECVSVLRNMFQGDKHGLGSLIKRAEESKSILLLNTLLRVVRSIEVQSAKLQDSLPADATGAEDLVSLRSCVDSLPTLTTTSGSIRTDAGNYLQLLDSELFSIGSSSRAIRNLVPAKRLDEITRQLESHFNSLSRAHFDTAWNGSFFTIDQEHLDAEALLVALGKWALVFEVHASEESLRRLAKSMLAATARHQSHPTSGLDRIATVVGSASFLELHRWREIIAQFLAKEQSPDLFPAINCFPLAYFHDCQTQLLAKAEALLLSTAAPGVAAAAIRVLKGTPSGKVQASALVQLCLNGERWAASLDSSLQREVVELVGQRATTDEIQEALHLPGESTEGALQFKIALGEALLPRSGSKFLSFFRPTSSAQALIDDLIADGADAKALVWQIRKAVLAASCLEPEKQVVSQTSLERLAASAIQETTAAAPLFQLLSTVSSVPAAISIMAKASSTVSWVDLINALPHRKSDKAHFDLDVAETLCRLDAIVPTGVNALAEAQAYMTALGLFLVNAPEGTSETVRTFFQLFLQSSQTYMQKFPSIAPLFVGVVHDICQSKVILLTRRHAELLFQMSFFLAGRSAVKTVPDAGSHTAVFLDLIGPLTTLIRHRRDLLQGLMQLVAELLARFVHALKRPQGEGSHRVAFPLLFGGNSRPRDELCARALARTLGTITVKTTTISTRQNASHAKLDSLGSQFSQHASVVLLAYVRAVLDDNGTISSALQRALEPGLFVLCDIISSHGRDAMLVADLDSAGKTVLKRLLSAWEAQRYKGQ